jgi:hypothetical protein
MDGGAEDCHHPSQKDEPEALYLELLALIQISEQCLLLLRRLDPLHKASSEGERWNGWMVAGSHHPCRKDQPEAHAELLARVKTSKPR